jgi:hypothetical protein
MNDRKEAIRKYKERKPSRGIFIVRCVQTGRCWVDFSPSLDSARNRVWFELRHGAHRNNALQEDWNAHGEDSFELEIAETLDPDIAEIAIRDELKRKRKEWCAKLGATTIWP